MPQLSQQELQACPKRLSSFSVNNLACDCRVLAEIARGTIKEMRACALRTSRAERVSPVYFLLSAKRIESSSSCCRTSLKLIGLAI